MSRQHFGSVARAGTEKVPAAKPRIVSRATPAAAAPKWKPRPVSSPPRVLVLSDVPNWAWARKAAALKKCLAGRIDVTVVHSTDRHNAVRTIRAAEHDLYHTFEVSQVGTIPAGWPMTTGITAHVAQAWKPEDLRAWSDRAVGFHANSRMLQREMEARLGRPVHYVPNGVDETFFRRTRRRKSTSLVVGYVARPNPRKGPEIVAEACRRAGVELLPIVRKWKDSDVLTPEQMLEYYQDIHVLAVSSDMDGTPNPALEAAACGCAVVSNPIGNMPEFLEHGVNGLITERTLDSLTAALTDLASRSIGEVERMGLAARETVLADWTWSKRAGAYADMWESCIGVTARETR